MPARSTIPGALELVCLLWVAFIWLWEPAYLTLSVDDSFYYLQIARHVAAGDGFTFDGLNPTNGFHPLWLLAFSGLAWLLPVGAETLMRAALTLQVAMVWGGLRLLGRACRPLASWIPVAGASLLLHFYFAKSLVNGMESALSFLLMAATLAVWASAPARSRWRDQVVGQLAGLSVVARLEALFFAAGAVLMPADPEEEPGGARRLLDRPALWLAPAVIVGGYLVANRLAFDHWLPVSSAIKTDRGLWGFGPTRLARAGLVAATALAAALLARRWAGSPERRAFLRLLGPLALYALGSAFLYQLLLGGTPPVWYLVPWSMLLVFGAALLFRSAAEKPRRRAPALLVSLLWLAWCGATWHHRLDPTSYSASLAARDNGRWLAARTPEAALAAGWASGIASAHSDRRLINLDGLANSWEYKERYLDQGKTQEFIDEVWPVEYLAVYFDRDYLEYFAENGYRGVEVAAWGVARARCVEFRSIVTPRRKRELVYMVLRRDVDEGAERFGRSVGRLDEMCRTR